MSDITVLLTGSEDFGKVEITVSATSPGDAVAKLSSAEYASLVEESVNRQALLAASMKVAHGGATLAPVTNITQAPSAQPAPAPAPQQSAWSQPPAQQGGHSGLHPAGETCPACGKTLVADTTRTGKKQWKCPEYRYSNGQANGHRVEWV